jgi:putative flippase GtrA
MSSKKDYLLVGIIGLAVGLLSQLILNTVGAKLFTATTLSEGQVRVGVVIFFTILAPFALWIAALVGKKIPVVFQFAKFAAVGSLNSFINLGVMNALTYFVAATPGDVRYGFFGTLAFLAATTNSYFWNRSWTFQANNKANAKEGVEFYVIAGLSWLLSIGVLVLSRRLFVGMGIDYNLTQNLISPICSFLAAFICNFLGYKFIVFKKEEPLATSH